MSCHKVFFAICEGAILLAAPTIPAQQGEQGSEPLPYGFSHEMLMDNPLLSASEHPAQYRAFTVPAKVWAGLSERPRLSLDRGTHRGPASGPCHR
jgi:hypothetical protein